MKTRPTSEHSISDDAVSFDVKVATTNNGNFNFFGLFGSNNGKPGTAMGWLNKESRGNSMMSAVKLKTWNKRFFVLEDGILSYYEGFDEVENKALNFKGRLDLQGSRLVSAEPYTGGNKGNFIAISDGNGDTCALLIEADSAEKAEKWQKVIQEHLDFLKTRETRVTSELAVAGDSVASAAASNDDKGFLGLGLFTSGSNERPVVTAGWLNKESRGRGNSVMSAVKLKNWRKRYCELTDGLLNYYEEFNEEKKLPMKLKGTLDLKEATLVNPRNFHGKCGTHLLLLTCVG